MAFSSLSNALYAVGKPIVRALFNTLKTNQDDLDTRLGTVEATGNKVIFYSGSIYTAGSYASVTGYIFHRIQASIDITDAKVIVSDFTGITSGTLQIDVQKASSRDFSASVSIFTTKPSLDLSTASNFDESSNMVLSGTNKVLIEGDWIRIDITSLPTGLGYLGVYLIGEPS